MSGWGTVLRYYLLAAAASDAPLFCLTLFYESFGFVFPIGANQRKNHVRETSHLSNVEVACVCNHWMEVSLGSTRGF
jgi:hypothetical protein